MIKNYNEWARLEDGFNVYETGYTISSNGYDISESWKALNKPSLNRLDESSFTADISRDEFINEAFPALNESNDEYSKNRLYALYETQLFYTHREEWFTTKSNKNIVPIIIESDTHAVIFYKDRSFAISKESYNVLLNENLNEWDLLGSIGSVFSDAGEIVSGAVGSVVDTVGDWTSKLGDAAKEVVAFVKSCYDAVASLAGGDWLNMVQTIATLFRGIYGTIGSIFAPGTGELVNKVVGGATGLIGVYTGYNRVKDPISNMIGNMSSAKSALDVGNGLMKDGPNVLSGASALIVGTKDIIGAFKPSADILSGITDLTSLFSSPKGDLQKQGESLFNPKNAKGLGGTILSMSGLNPKSTFKPDALLKNLQPQLISLGGSIAVEYMVPTDIKETVLGGARNVVKAVDSALSIPKQAESFITNLQNDSKGGTMSILVDAVAGIGKPLVSGLKNFSDSIKPSVDSAVKPVTNMIDKHDKTIKAFNSNGLTSALDSLNPIDVQESGEVEVQKPIQLPKKELKKIKKNQKKIKKVALKESYFNDYETWLKRNF